VSEELYYYLNADDAQVVTCFLSSAGEMQRELIPAIREYRLLGTQQWSSSEADTLLH
jgi:hypothetical protein